MPDFTENDLRDIERDRDLPPDEPYPHRWHEDDDHGPDCAIRFSPASECTCGKADALLADEGPTGLAAFGPYGEEL